MISTCTAQELLESAAPFLWVGQSDLDNIRTSMLCEIINKGGPLTVDSTLITVDSTTITADQTIY